MSEAQSPKSDHSGANEQETPLSPESVKSNKSSQEQEEKKGNFIQGAAEQMIGGLAGALAGDDSNDDDGNQEKPKSNNQTPNQSPAHSKPASKSTSARSEKTNSTKSAKSSKAPSENGDNNDEQDDEEEDQPNSSSPLPDSELTSEHSKSTDVAPLPIKKKTTKKKKKTPEQDKPPQEEIDAALDLLLHGVPPEDFDPVTLKCCILQLQSLKKDSVANKNYLEADYYANLIKQASKAADVANFSQQCTSKLNELMEKQADAQDKVDEVSKGWEDTFQEFEQMVEIKMKDLTDAQTKELDEFDGNIPDDLPPKYNKHSTEYVLMRKREKLLLINEEYVTADSVQKKADALEKEELTQQQMKLQDDLQRQRNSIIEKHNKQFENFAQWVNIRRHEMLRARDNDLEGPVKRLTHYTNLVNRIEKKGLPPNPTYGFTTNRVSRKESIKAVRTAAQTPLERDESKKKPREPLPIPQFRPSSAMRTSQNGIANTTQKTQKK